jgi:hypothetical protein
MKKTLLLVLEFLTKNETFKSGQKAPYAGIYRSEEKYIALSKKEKFPPSLDLWVTVFTL